MRLEIRYLNEFRYQEPARESHNQLRACPASNHHQQLISYHVETTPQARVCSYLDFWGTRVDEFGVREPHHLLRICAESVVETTPPPQPSAADLSVYPALAGKMVGLLRPSPHVRWDREIEARARQAVAGAGDAVSAVGAVAESIHDTLEYRPGATFVGVDLSQVLSRGKGVCQDFAHLGIAMCRSLGIPARYVSGYLYAADQTSAVAPDQPDLEVQTHAWMEAFIPGHGWWAVDPTNRQPAGELHVKIGHGRDYEDVMPLRGVYHGGAEHHLGVSVSITRERLSRVPEQ